MENIMKGVQKNLFKGASKMDFVKFGPSCPLNIKHGMLLKKNMKHDTSDILYKR